MKMIISKRKGSNIRNLDQLEFYQRQAREEADQEDGLIYYEPSPQDDLIGEFYGRNGNFAIAATVVARGYWTIGDASVPVVFIHFENGDTGVWPTDDFFLNWSKL